MSGRWTTFVVLLLVVFAAGQKPYPPPLPAERFPSSMPVEARRQAVVAAGERQQALRQDSARLLQLATALKQELDIAPSGTVPATSLRHSEEIEKVAKRLKKELRGQP